MEEERVTGNTIALGCFYMFAFSVPTIAIGFMLLSLVYWLFTGHVPFE